MSDVIPATAILEIMEEPKPIQVAQIYNQKQNPMNGRVYSAEGISLTLRTPTGGLSEPCILGYTRDDKGNVTSRHEKEIAGTLHTSTGNGGNTDQFVKEPITRKDDVVFKEMPDGNIHAYRAHDPKKSTAPEWQITNADNVHPTLTTSHESKVLLRYRIRKLTERECFRLMDVDDSDIDKIEAHRIKVTLKNGTVKEKPIPKSAKYKLAGNSIVVSCLYHIFHQMFIVEPPEPNPIQKSLFDF